MEVPKLLHTSADSKKEVKVNKVFKKDMYKKINEDRKYKDYNDDLWINIGKQPSPTDVLLFAIKKSLSNKAVDKKKAIGKAIDKKVKVK